MTPPATSTSPSRRPTHPLIAHGLIGDEVGRWLVVRPLGEQRWTLPGGQVGQNESLRDACVRAVREELGLAARPGALLAVGWTAPRLVDRPARVSFIFDMGEHASTHLERIIGLQHTDLADWQLVAPRQALNVLHPEVGLRLSAYRSVDSTAVYVEHHPARHVGTH